MLFAERPALQVALLENRLVIGRAGQLWAWFATTNARVAGAFAVALALQGIGTVLIPGYSAPFAIRAMLVIAAKLETPR